MCVVHSFPHGKNTYCSLSLPFVSILCSLSLHFAHSIFLSVCRSFNPSRQEDILLSLSLAPVLCMSVLPVSLSLFSMHTSDLHEPHPPTRQLFFFQTKIAETIAARPLDSTHATRAAHAAQSGCAATGPLTGRRGGQGLTGGSQPGYREKWSWPQMNGRPHRPLGQHLAQPCGLLASKQEVSHPLESG